MKRWLQTSLTLFVHGAPGVGKKTFVSHHLRNRKTFWLDGRSELYQGLMAGRTSEIFSEAKKSDFLVLHHIPYAHNRAEVLGKLSCNIGQCRLIIIDSYIRDYLEQNYFSAENSDVIELGTLTFDEYLRAMGRHALRKSREKVFEEKDVSDTMHLMLLRAWYAYVAVGGLPAAVNAFINDENVEAEQRRVRDEIFAYIRELRHIVKTPHLEQTLKAVMSLGGKKFFYSEVPHLRAFQVKHALELLCDIGVVREIVHTSIQGGKIDGGINPKFCRYAFFDTGVLRAFCADRIHLKNVSFKDPVMGRYVDAYVAREIAAISPSLYWWRREQTGADASVDFVVQVGGNIIPITLVDDHAGSFQSVKLILTQKLLEGAVHLTNAKFSQRQAVESVPIYCLDFLLREGD